MRVALLLALLCLLGTLSVTSANRVSLSQGVMAPTKPASGAKSAPVKVANPSQGKGKAPVVSAGKPTGTPTKAGKQVGGAVAKPSAVPVGAQPENESTGFPELDAFLKQSGIKITADLLPPELRYPLQDLPPLAKCHVPRKLRVRQEPYNSHRQVSQPLIRSIVGEPNKYIPLETTVEGQSFSCVDSRKQGPILGTPGGDFGEFLVGLSVVEDLLKRKLDDNEVHRLLAQWVAWDKKGNYTFFHHTDEDSVRRLGSNLHVNGMANVITNLNIYDPPMEVREEFLGSLNRTEFQGSHVIKSFLNYPRKFMIRKGLTSSLLRSYYATLWDRKTKLPDGSYIYKKLNLEVYRGEPQPKAWVSVRSTGNCEIVGAAHKFSPANPVPIRLLNNNNNNNKLNNNNNNNNATNPTKGNAKPSSSKPTSKSPTGSKQGGKPASFLETLQLSESDLLLNTDMSSSSSESPESLLELSSSSSSSSSSTEQDADYHTLFNSYLEMDTQYFGYKNEYPTSGYDNNYSTQGYDNNFDQFAIENQLEVYAEPIAKKPATKPSATTKATTSKPATTAKAKATAKPSGKASGKPVATAKAAAKAAATKATTTATKATTATSSGKVGGKGKASPVKKDEKKGVNNTKSKKVDDKTKKTKTSEPMGVAQVYVHHPHAVTIQRKWLSRFFALRYPMVGSQPYLYQAIARKQRAVTEGIAEILGSTVPFYTITVE